MVKNSMEDMIKIKIIKKAPVRKAYDKSLPTNSSSENYFNQKKKKSGRRYILWLTALFSFVFLFFSLSYMFSVANITIDPKIEEVEINENLSASKNSKSSPLSFDLVVISGEENKNIETEEKRNFETQAKGVVVIYNAFSVNSQTLNIDTRLEGSNGKIYKTEKKIVIPGMSKDGTPGKIEVGIYGASGGEEYNSEPLDFQVLGFKGTSKYSKIYGRSKGEIIGGVKGEFYTISAEKKEDLLKDLESSLQAKLLSKAVGQIPEGFVLFREAVFLDIIDSNSEIFSEEPSVLLNIKGTLYGFLFEEEKLTKKIVNDVLKKYDGSDVYISNMGDLSFSVSDKKKISFSDVKDIYFTLKGKAKIVWKFNLEKFVNELLGRGKGDFNSILSRYPNVVSANLVLKPFWRMSFPDKTKDIKVIINYPD